MRLVREVLGKANLNTLQVYTATSTAERKRRTSATASSRGPARVWRHFGGRYYVRGRLAFPPSDALDMFDRWHSSGRDRMRTCAPGRRQGGGRLQRGRVSATAYLESSILRFALEGCNLSKPLVANGAGFGYAESARPGMKCPLAASPQERRTLFRSC